MCVRERERGREGGREGRRGIEMGRGREGDCVCALGMCVRSLCTPTVCVTGHDTNVYYCITRGVKAAGSED